MNLIKLYRAKDWIKSLGFCLLGLNLGFVQYPPLLFLGLIQSILLFSFLFSFNDFFDYIIHKEKNYIGKIIAESILPKELVFLLCLLPLILSVIPLFLKFSVEYIILYSLFITLSISYSLPKVRLRDIPFIDIICNVFFFSLIFLQSYFFLNSIATPKVYFLLFWIIFYIFSHEILHQIYHFNRDRESGRLTTAILLRKKRSINLLKFSFLLPIIFGVLVYSSFPNLEIFAVIMILFSFLRFFYIYSFNEKSDFKKLRNGLYGIFEGGLYFILNFLGI
jgi:4-hydroxybenzoate polyprenyltransferase